MGSFCSGWPAGKSCGSNGVTGPARLQRASAARHEGQRTVHHAGSQRREQQHTQVQGNRAVATAHRRDRNSAAAAPASPPLRRTLWGSIPQEPSLQASGRQAGEAPQERSTLPCGDAAPSRHAGTQAQPHAPCSSFPMRCSCASAGNLLPQPGGSVPVSPFLLRSRFARLELLQLAGRAPPKRLPPRSICLLASDGSASGSAPSAAGGGQRAGHARSGAAHAYTAAAAPTGACRLGSHMESKNDRSCYSRQHALRLEAGP